MSNTYRLKIVRGSMEFEAEGDKAFVLKMAERFAEGSVPAGPVPDQGGEHPRKGEARVVVRKTGKQISVREFIQKLGLKKHTDIVVAFGYYLEHDQGKDSFTAADVNNLYYEAKLEPSNTSQALIQNIMRTFVMEAKKDAATKGGRKAYVLTSSGEEFIKGKLGAARE